MRRRDLMLGAAAAAATLPRVAAGQGARRVLKFVPHANLTSLDPIWTTATITRNHGYMVFDCLYGIDAEFQPRPQMAEGTTFEDGGRIATVTLRDGPRFHDGEKVLARDCVASLRRWMKRSPMGQKLETYTDALEVLDDRRLRFRLKKPFPRLLAALGSVASPAPIIMPERLALTDPFQQVREMIGSGPFRFIASDYNTGSLVAYEKFDRYSPTPDGWPSLTAGPKIPHIDRVEWHIITDHATAAAALQRGEMDWYENVPVEIQQLLRRSRDITVERLDPLPSTGVLRFNFLHPIFNDVAMRRALLPAISQADFMQAIVGTDPDLWKDGVGCFTPGTPLANDAGLAPLLGPRSLDKARADLKAAGYTDQLVRLLVPTDILAPSAISQVCADLFRRLGMNVDAPNMDWGTAVQRRTSREPLDKGGWSVVLTTFNSFEFADPAGHFPLRGNGTGGWPGWPTMPKLEELRDAWFDAPDLETEKRLAREIQTVAMAELPYIPIGAYWTNTARRRTVTDRVPGFAIFWNLKKA